MSSKVSSKSTKLSAEAGNSNLSHPPRSTRASPFFSAGLLRFNRRLSAASFYPALRSCVVIANPVVLFAIGGEACLPQAGICFLLFLSRLPHSSAFCTEGWGNASFSSPLLHCLLQFRRFLTADSRRLMAANKTAIKRTTNSSSKKARPRYKRVVLKLSGESLQGPQGYGIHGETVQAIARELKDVHALGVQVAVMVGGGNIFRGGRQKGLEIDRATGDYMGMLATVINALALQDALEKEGVYTRVQSAIAMNEVAEPFIRRRAVRHLEKGRIVIFAAGTGNPYFSTDTAAALRAMEMKADVILKATRVDGIYDADPEQVTGARFLTQITYRDVLNQNLKVMDSTAISLCMDNGMPIVVFNMNEYGNIKRVVLGERVGSTVTPA